MEVRRQSQVHQMPQMMRAQIMPVTRLAAPKASPTSVAATAKASHSGFGAQVGDGRDQGHEEAQEASEGAGDVKENDAEDGALKGLVREAG